MAKYYQRRGRRSPRRKHEHYINKYIRASQVRFIDEEGQNLGVIPTKDALAKAKENGLDLVLIAEKADPPVAKMLDYSKFLYEERKKQASSKSKSSKSETKELIFGPNIDDGDLQTRIERTMEFVEDGHRVKMSVKMRGRQMAHPEIGMEKLEKAMAELSDVARVEEEPERKGNLITVVFVKK